MTDEKRIAEIEQDCIERNPLASTDVPWLIAELRASQAECELLHKHDALWTALHAERDAERAQLAEAVVLLRRVLDTYSRDGMGPGSSRRIAAHGDARAFLAKVTT